MNEVRHIANLVTYYIYLISFKTLKELVRLIHYKNKYVASVFA